MADAFFSFSAFGGVHFVKSFLKVRPYWSTLEFILMQICCSQSTYFLSVILARNWA